MSMVSPYTMDDAQPGQLLQKVLRTYMRTNHAMRIAPSQNVSKLLFCLLLNSVVVSAVAAEESQTHGLVGLRPLPRTEEDWKASHGGSWHGTPTYEAQKGKYPFVAEHVDVVSGWLDGDFRTKRVFFEHYWGLAAELDDLDPKKNPLVKKIKNWEEKGGTVEHILICREYDLAITRGYKDAKPGPFKEDTRILFESDVDNIRTMFKEAHEQGILKRDNYSLIQMVQHPNFFAIDKRFQPVLNKMEGVAYEAHQFNRHWPRETGWGKPEKIIQGAKWTLNQGKEYIFYYGPIIWKDDKEKYYDFVERDWLIKFWREGLPKLHPKMHYYLNIFPNESGRMRPCGPETDPHSNLGFTKWLIEEIKMPTETGMDTLNESP
jgi:hypothetical protein